jgi:hypothetical protein
MASTAPALYMHMRGHAVYLLLHNYSIKSNSCNKPHVMHAHQHFERRRGVTRCVQAATPQRTPTDKWKLQIVQHGLSLIAQH